MEPIDGFEELQPGGPGPGGPGPGPAPVDLGPERLRSSSGGQEP
jgi:hypothetical protein